MSHGNPALSTLFGSFGYDGREHKGFEISQIQPMLEGAGESVGSGTCDTSDIELKLRANTVVDLRA